MSFTSRQKTVALLYMIAASAITIESRDRPDRPGEVTAIRIDVQSCRPPCKRPGEALLAEPQQTERKGNDEGALRQLEHADDREHRVSRTGHGEDVPR